MRCHTPVIPALRRPRGGEGGREDEYATAELDGMDRWGGRDMLDVDEQTAGGSHIDHRGMER